MATKIYPHELIGEEIEVVDSTNPSHKGIKGKIIDETKATLLVKTQQGVKTLLKNNVVIKLSKNAEIIEGVRLCKKPEDRVKGK